MAEVFYWLGIYVTGLIAAAIIQSMYESVKGRKNDGDNLLIYFSWLGVLMWLVLILLYTIVFILGGFETEERSSSLSTSIVDTFRTEHRQQDNDSDW